MRTASIIINWTIFVATFALTLRCFRYEGEWALRRGLKAFRYFTVLSNVFCALTALVMALAQMKDAVTPAVLLLKYLGTVSVTVTLLTVFLFLGPTQGYRTMLEGDNLYMHLIGPGLAIGSFCFLEKQPFSFPVALLGLLPVALYGALYLYRVIYAPEATRWEDFYGFNMGGKWPLSFAAMLLGTLLVCVALWLA